MTRSAELEAQGTGFIHLRDPDGMRVILLWEVHLPQGWAAAFDGWRPRPLNLRAHDRNGMMQHAYRGRRASYFHPEVADRLLGLSRQEAGREAGESSARAVDRRRSLALPVLVDHHDGETVTLRIGALEALRVTDGESACEAILVLHAEVPDPDYLRHYLTVANSASLSEVGATIEAVLAEVCGPGKVSLASDRSDRSGWVGAPPVHHHVGAPGGEFRLAARPGGVCRGDVRAPRDARVRPGRQGHPLLRPDRGSRERDR